MYAVYKKDWLLKGSNFTNITELFKETWKGKDFLHMRAKWFFSQLREYEKEMRLVKIHFD